MDLITIIFIFVQAFVCGFVSQAIASAKGHDHGGIFWLGFFFSLIGILFAIGIPAKERESGQDVPKLSRKRPAPPVSKQADIYLQLNGEVQGPFTQEQIEGFLQAGVATKETLFCIEGTEDWQPLSLFVPI